MTNEEKINEIENLKPINWISKEDLCTYQQGLRRGAFEMAKFMIEKASEWLKEHAEEYPWYDFDAEAYKIPDNFLTDFKQAMEE